MRLLGYTLIQYDWCLYEKHRRNPGAALGEPHTVLNTESGGVELSAKDGKRFSATTEEGRHSKVLPRVSEEVWHC